MWVYRFSRRVFGLESRTTSGSFSPSILSAGLHQVSHCHCNAPSESLAGVGAPNAGDEIFSRMSVAHFYSADDIVPKLFRGLDCLDNSPFAGPGTGCDQPLERAEWLTRERILSIKNNGEINRVERGIPFLGFVVRPKGIRLQSRSARRYSRKLGALKRAFRRGECGERELQERSASLVAATRLAGAEGFRRAVERRQIMIGGYT